MNKEPIPSNEFRLAITMAGAASAGCYTGGVMDYLFEILDLWERAKKGEVENLKGKGGKIPRHQVVIDAMGGTSAGGMTTAMSAIYALNGKINPVKVPGEVKEKKQNLFYDSWVLMDDHSTKDPRLIFEKVWDTSDLEEGKVGSLLNSQFIDTIASQSFDYTGNIEERTRALPGYISKNMQMLFSHCLLRGMPLDVTFETPISKKGHKSVLPNHTTFEHYIISHYHLNNGKAPDKDKYLWLNPYEDAYSKTLKLATKATGAFPAGLLYREFTPEHFGESYLKTTLKRIISGEFGNPDPDPDEKIKLKYIPKEFSSFTVDGGAINNEPYREVLSILKDKYGETPEDGYHRYGVIMIDPFPDRAQTAKTYERPNDLMDVIPEILSTLTDQSRIKRREMLEADTSKYFRSIIFPRKWVVDSDFKPLEPEATAIASSSAMAFGGFLDIRFRQHDFFLGRNNARNFFRYFFSFPFNDGSKDINDKVIHPIHATWTPEMIEAFKIEHNGQTFLPIIPDLNILSEDPADKKKRQYRYDIPQLPLYDPESLFKLLPAIEQRFRRIIEVLKTRDFSKEKKDAKEKLLRQLPEKERGKEMERELEMELKMKQARTWMDKFYKPAGRVSSLMNRIKKPFINLGFRFAKGIIAKRLTKKTINSILNDLAGKGLLKKPE